MSKYVMNDAKRCRHCNKLYWFDHPARRYRVADDDLPDDERTYDEARRVCAFDHEEAAERWAEEDDARGDYTIVSGGEATVLVWREGEPDSPRKYAVTGETVPSYSATEHDDSADRVRLSIDPRHALQDELDDTINAAVSANIAVNRLAERAASYDPEIADEMAEAARTLSDDEWYGWAHQGGKRGLRGGEQE